MFRFKIILLITGAVIAVMLWFGSQGPGTETFIKWWKILFDRGIIAALVVLAFADFYALRHSFISWLANAGTPPRTLQQLARHASIETTLKYYTHTTDEHQIAAVDALPDFGVETKPRVIRRSA